MEFQIELSMLGRMFMLPAAVVDSCLHDIDGDSLKVLLCVYCLGKPKVTAEEIGSLSGVSEEKVKEALELFAQNGIIKLSGYEYKNTPTKSDVSDLKLIGQPKAIRGTKKKTKKMSTVKYSPKDLAEKLENDKDLKMLCDDMENLLAKPLKHSNLADIIEMYEHLELKPDAIMMIAAYCKKQDKTTTAYILTVAQDWFKEGITDFKSIDRKIITLDTYHSFENRMKRIIGINTNITQEYKEYFELWQKYNFSDAMLTIAYDRTMKHCDNQFGIEYMNQILVSWFENDIKTPEQAENEKQKHKNETDNYKKNEAKDEYQEYLESLDYSTYKRGDDLNGVF